MNNTNSSKQVLVSILGVAILIVAVVGISFAAFSYSKTGTVANTITTGTITMSYSEPTNGINLTNALPITDTAGKALTGNNNTFDFTVAATVSGSTTINYAITAVKGDECTVADSGVKVYLTDQEDAQILAPTKVSALTTTTSENAAGAPAGQYILKTGTYSETKTEEYRLRMWVADDYTAPSTQQKYVLKVNVYGQAPAK
ncbi:MAG: hypothetical protein PUB03_00580 [bacterium]|nr:hypothetical protein [bacterium]